MYLTSKLLYLYTETPLHVGAGTGLGAIDLPIQRERYTGYPIIQASGLKGALRNHCIKGAEKSDDRKKFLSAFGPENAEYAGALGVGDARILLFLIRSLIGVFAWITCPDVLQRRRREVVSLSDEHFPEIPSGPLPQSTCYAGNGVQANKRVVLEEYTFKVENDYNLADLANYIVSVLPSLKDPKNPGKDYYAYWIKKLPKNLIILRNDEFRDLVMHTTEVLTRVRLDPNTKTAMGQALWNEENLPADTLLYAPIRATPLRATKDKVPSEWAGKEPKQQAADVINWVTKSIPSLIQIGGDETIGRGFIRLTWRPEIHKDEKKEG